MGNYINDDMKTKREIRKAKRYIVSVFLLIFVICPLVIYGIYNVIFPKAEKFDYPDYSSVESITVSKEGEQIYLSDEECRVLYNYIRTSKPTRIMSTNETPDVTPFFTIEIKSNDISIYGYGYIYQENERFYFEIPYVGVYRICVDFCSTTLICFKGY